MQMLSFFWVEYVTLQKEWNKVVRKPVSDTGMLRSKF